MKKAVPAAGLALAAAAALAFAATAHGQDASPVADPSITAYSHAEDMVTARILQMVEIEALQLRMEAYAAGAEDDPDLMRSLAYSVSSLMLAVPHLFPSTTNFMELPHSEDVSTVALPAIWQDFETFYALAIGVSDVALETAQAEDEATLKAGIAAIRQGCDACHASFMQAYAPPIPPL